MRFWIALIGSSALAMAGATQAQAADQPQAANRDSDTGEIVVTAQKREQNILDVPVSVSVVGAAQLDRQNIAGINDLTQSVTSLGPPTGIGGAGISIRGVATGGFARSSEQSVSVVLDGVTLGRAQVSELADIERVEVLSGPQGMLFGKNASAGVINIVTKAPTFGEFELIGHGDFGNYEFQRQRLTVNVPLGSNAAIRATGNHRRVGGYLFNTLSGKDLEPSSYGGRVRLLWEPSSSLRFNLIGDFQRDQAGNGMPSAAFVRTNAFVLANIAAFCPTITVSLANNKNCAEGIPTSSKVAQDTQYGVSGQFDLTLANDFVITSITANRWRKGGDFDYRGLGGDTDGLPIDLVSTNLTPARISTFSQELRLTSPSRKQVEFVAGVYFSKTNTFDTVVQGGFAGIVPGARFGRGSQVSIEQTSYAAFGQATFHVNDQLSLIAGGRFTHDRLKDKARPYTPVELAPYGFLPIELLPFGFTTPAPLNLDYKEDNFSWKLGAMYDVSPNLNVYFTASRGYKGAASNDQADPAIVPVLVKSEKPMFFELGAKATLIDRRLYGTVALFSNKVNNYQTDVFTPATPANPVPGFAQGNAPYILSQGIDINVFGKITPELTLNAGVIYNRAKYAPTYVVQCSQVQVRGVGNCVQVAPGTFATKPVDQVAGIPKWRVLLNGEYAQEVGSNLTAFLQADFVYQTGVSYSSSPDPFVAGGDQYLLGGRLGMRASDGRWGASVFVRNLLDNNYPVIINDPLAGFTNVLGGLGGLPPGPSYASAPSINSHRSYGVTVDFRF